MAALNRRHRGKKGPTDVLSFPLEEALAGPLSKNSRAPWTSHRKALGREIEIRRKHLGLPALALGDVVICHPVARAQAKEFGETLQEAYARLLAHGLAHLLGYDHERGRAWQRAMRRVEGAMLAASQEAVWVARALRKTSF